MFDPANPFALPPGHPLLAPTLSPAGMTPDLVRESLDFLGSLAGLNSFAGDGGLWRTVAGPQGAGGGALGMYWLLNSGSLHRLIRYTARATYELNGICQAAVDIPEALALGDGFTYTASDPADDARLQTWLKKNKWSARSSQYFREEAIDGELILRLFGAAGDKTVRKVDPDFLYSVHDKSEDGFTGRNQGIFYDNDDHDEELFYEIHKTPVFAPGQAYDQVPAAEVQYRSRRMFNERRGKSGLLPILANLAKSDQLILDLLGTASSQAKFAFVRKWNAPSESVELMQAEIRAERSRAWRQGDPVAPFGSDHGDRYPAGSIPDVPQTCTIEHVGADDFAQWVETIDASLRVVAMTIGVPYEVLSGKQGDRGSYNSAIVAHSLEEKILGRKQQRWAQYDLELISRATDIEAESIDQHVPPIATPDRKAEIEQVSTGIDKRVMSRKTARLIWGLDPEAEEQNILEEEASGLYDPPQAPGGDENSPGSPEAAAGGESSSEKAP